MEPEWPPPVAKHLRHWRWSSTIATLCLAEESEDQRSHHQARRSRQGQHVGGVHPVHHERADEGVRGHAGEGNAGVEPCRSPESPAPNRGGDGALALSPHY